MKEHQVAIVSPAMPGNQKKFHLSEFTLDDHGKILTCPQGAAPDRVKKTKSDYSAAFAAPTCRACPVFDQYPLSKGKKARYYQYNTKDIRLARRCQDEDSPNFREQYRYRAGVEATMSELDRRTGIKHLRIRGMKAVRFAAFMKAIGLNILRASRYRGGKTSPLAPFYALFLLLMKQWGCFKELIQERFTPTV